MKTIKKVGKVSSTKNKNQKMQDSRKIAINSCYGGFGLSPKAIHRLACRLGKPCYFFTRDCINNGESKYVYQYTPVDGYPTGIMWYAFTVKDPENHEYKDIVIKYPEDRSNPDLIAVIEELGEEANGLYAEIKIVKIPSDVKWEINEYDGLEHIAEIHQTWQ